MRPLIASCLFLACLSAPLSHAATGEKRMALVIGNGKYAQSPLKNPVNDAQAVAARLKQLGFDVTLKLDAGRGDMVEAIRGFGRKARQADVRLFYYAGHASQVKGGNYLVPIGEKIEYESEVAMKGIGMEHFFDVVRPLDKGINIVILDACRNNPYKVGSRGEGNRGLARLESFPIGTFIAFAADAGATADDNPADSNSLYTRHLLEAMTIPGLPIELAFKRIRTAVASETRNRQTPWDNTSLRGADFCFVPGKDGKCVGAVQPPIVVAAAKPLSPVARSDGEENSLAQFRALQARAETLTPDDLAGLRRQAEEGDTHAMTILGLWHETHGKLTFMNTQPEAVKWYRRAAGKGYAPAEYLLGWAYNSGLVTGQPDPDTARRYFEIGARKQYVPALRALGDHYYHHPRDYAKAMVYYRQAADKGHPGGMAGLALLHLKGQGTAQDIRQAEHWARTAYETDAGEQIAQHILGYLYHRQLIKPRDEADQLTLVSLRQLRQTHGRFAYGLE